MTTRQQINTAANDLAALLILIRDMSDEKIDRLLDRDRISVVHTLLHRELDRSRRTIQANQDKQAMDRIHRRSQ